MLSVREIEHQDISLLCDYWLNSDHDFMRGMGVDISKVPSREEFSAMLTEQISQPYTEKKSYCLIWELDGTAVGHSNISKIIFGEEAYMHLHLWNSPLRKKGMGVEFVKLGIPLFFKNMQLKRLYSEPYALNPAPNKALPKAGFKFVKSHTCIPGWLNFEQEVNLYEIQGDSAFVGSR